MGYSKSQIANLKTKLMRKINAELDLAVKNDEVENFLKKYCVEIEEMPYYSGVTRRSKILVLGQLSGKTKDYLMAAKKLGVDSENLKFVDYSEVKHLNAERLRYSSEYSDIICGPIPHKVEGMGDTSSLLAKIEKNPSEYPKLIKAETNQKLKFSVTGFKNYILKTRFFEENIVNI